MRCVEPLLLWSALRSFSGNVDVETGFCEGVVVSAQRVSIPPEAGFSQLPSDRSDAVSVSDVVVADVVEANDAADPSYIFVSMTARQRSAVFVTGQHSTP